MPRIDTLRLTIHSGSRGSRSAVRIRLAVHELEVHRISGGTGGGETFVGERYVGAPATAIELLGDPEGDWEIRGLEVSISFDDAPDFHRVFENLTIPAARAHRVPLEEGEAHAAES